MALFDLFRKSEWEKLKAYPPDVQQDIAYLVALDSLIKTAVANTIHRTFRTQHTSHTNVSSILGKVLTDQIMAREMHLAILTTGIGKELSTIRWSYLPPFRAVSCLGILAMCEFRNAEQIAVQNDLKHSGYSSDPDEARTQILVLMANTKSVEDLDQVRAFDEGVFRDFWVGLRKMVFTDLQLSASSEPLGLSRAIKERFERLSGPRKEILLLLAEALSRKKPNADTKPEAPKVAPAPFNREQSQKEHPFKYVPYPKLIQVMNGLSPRIMQIFQELSIDNYELRRVVGAKDVVPDAILKAMVAFDANIAAYCIVVAAVLKSEPGFIGCGVWKKLNEAFEKGNMAQFGLAAEVKANGMLGDAKINLEIDDPRRSSLAFNLLLEIRRAPTNYTETTGDDQERVRVLLAGTMILQHVLNHPRYGKALLPYVIKSFTSLSPVLNEIKNGELFTWSEQEKLSV
ncbi:MAG: hypothetical protein HY848_22850 [Betaproteobacteria bacterium]|nr:hypothetical protein [Betaproteobacteria bacterium]